MSSKITLYFNSLPLNGDTIDILDSYTPDSLINLLYGINIAITTDLAESVLFTYNYINLNNNSSNRYTLTPNYTLGSESLEILDNLGFSTFTEDLNDTSGRITTIGVNDPETILLTIDDVSITENVTDPCNLVDISIGTNFQADFINSPVSQATTTNPILITDISRDSINDILITVEATSINEASKSIFVPVLSSSFFDIQIVSIPSGSTVTVLWTGTKQPYFDLLYSIDDVYYSSASSFSNLQEGNYTLYIKDNIGCDITIPFEITAFELDAFERVPFFNVSQQNSLISVKREEIDDITIFKNDTNTLSYEEETSINNRSFVQLYKKTDGIIKQQFKSNYETNTVKLIDCNGTESIIVPEKKTSNLSVRDLRDTTIIKVDYFGAEFVGVKYVQGNTYDPNTLIKTGEYYLGNSVPDFMTVDDYIGFGSSWFRVKDIVILDNVQVLVLDVLVINFIVEIVGQVLKAESVYNILPYEVYEYSFDCDTLDGYYHINYEVSDSEFDTLKEITEWFYIAEEQPRTYMLQYYNTVNNETNYSTGITNKIRVPYEITKSYGAANEQDIYITDTNVVQIKASYRDLFTLEVRQAPMGFIRKIGLATTNDRLFLNGLSLVREGDVEIERDGLTNEYKATINFNRSDYVFSSIDEDGSVVLPSGQPLAKDDSQSGLLFIKD